MSHIESEMEGQIEGIQQRQGRVAGISREGYKENVVTELYS